MVRDPGRACHLRRDAPPPVRASRPRGLPVVRRHPSGGRLTAAPPGDRAPPAVLRLAVARLSVRCPAAPRRGDAALPVPPAASPATRPSPHALGPSADDPPGVPGSPVRDRLHDLCSPAGDPLHDLCSPPAGGPLGDPGLRACGRPPGLCGPAGDLPPLGRFRGNAPALPRTFPRKRPCQPDEGLPAGDRPRDACRPVGDPLPDLCSPPAAGPPRTPRARLARTPRARLPSCHAGRSGSACARRPGRAQQEVSADRLLSRYGLARPDLLHGVRPVALPVAVVSRCAAPAWARVAAGPREVGAPHECTGLVRRSPAEERGCGNEEVTKKGSSRPPCAAPRPVRCSSAAGIGASHEPVRGGRTWHQYCNAPRGPHWHWSRTAWPVSHCRLERSCRLCRCRAQRCASPE